MVYFLYNELANAGQAVAEKDKAVAALEPKLGKVEVLSVVGLDYDAFLKKVKAEDKVILFGGDGTLMRFANFVYGKKLACPFYLYRGGTGNDFLNDVKDEIVDDMVELNKFLENLPVVYANDKEYRFLNGIGFGIDGYVCGVAEEMKANGATKINYSSLSVKNLLHGYNPPCAKITVDGETKEYKKVWLASTMNGRYYGGGMINAPEQDRLSDTVSAVCWWGTGRLKTLLNFPKIFKGEHVKKTKFVEVRVGHEIIVEFDTPMALQIDGEVVPNVKSYRVVKK